MTRNREIDLQDLVECDHSPELALHSDGKIVGYVCRCGRRTHEPPTLDTGDGAGEDEAHG